MNINSFINSVYNFLYHSKLELPSIHDAKEIIFNEFQLINFVKIYVLSLPE